MFFRLPVVVVFSVAASALFAQVSPASSNGEPSNQVLLERIQQLEKRISELENRQRNERAVPSPSSVAQIAATARATPHTFS